MYLVDKLTIEIGLGLRPDLTSKGIGGEFLRAGIQFIQTKYMPKRIILFVTTFNKRAIKVYKKNRFKEVTTFMQKTNGSCFKFLQMSYHC